MKSSNTANVQKYSNNGFISVYYSSSVESNKNQIYNFLKGDLAYAIKKSKDRSGLGPTWIQGFECCYLGLTPPPEWMLSFLYKSHSREGFFYLAGKIVTDTPKVTFLLLCEANYDRECKL